jgi:GNAT superfamily N-acetyltransferase
MHIHMAYTDEEIAACYQVMRELRPQLDRVSFVKRIRALEEGGYRLACLRETDRPVAVAGFRMGESLAWGRFMYVDDLVTLASQRSRGFGAALLDWLVRLAVEEGCEQLHLDSGVQRKDAHRFYGREGLQLASYHYARYLTPDTASKS